MAQLVMLLDASVENPSTDTKFSMLSHERGRQHVATSEVKRVCSNACVAYRWHRMRQWRALYKRACKSHLQVALQLRSWENRRGTQRHR